MSNGEIIFLLACSCQSYRDLWQVCYVSTKIRFLPPDPTANLHFLASSVLRCDHVTVLTSEMWVDKRHITSRPRLPSPQILQ